jgi:hypothetical protein
MLTTQSMSAKLALPVQICVTCKVIALNSGYEDLQAENKKLKVRVKELEKQMEKDKEKKNMRPGMFVHFLLSFYIHCLIPLTSSDGVSWGIGNEYSK